MSQDVQRRLEALEESHQESLRRQVLLDESMTRAERNIARLDTMLHAVIEQAEILGRLVGVNIDVLQAHARDRHAHG